MKASSSIEPIWKLAGQEAMAGQFGEIEPEHFCMALMKFAELPVDEIDRLAPGSSAVQQLLAEAQAVREELEKRRIDSKRVRRELRRRLGKGGNPQTAGRMHRSQASRNLMDAAARRAAETGGDVLVARFLLDQMLDSPSPAMAEALYGRDFHVQPGQPKPGATLLENHGQAMVQAASRMLRGGSGRETEGKALARILSRDKGKSVLLICDEESIAASVVSAAAQILSTGSIKPGTEPRQIVDVTKVQPAASDPEGWQGLIAQLSDEAAQKANIILYLPAADIVVGESNKEDAANELRVMLRDAKAQCVLRMDTTWFQDYVEGNRDWRKVAQYVSIRERASGKTAIPEEL